MNQSELAKVRKDKFIAIYSTMTIPNASEAARQAGYSPNRAAVTGSEMLKDPYVREKLNSLQALQKELMTDGDLSVDDIFDSTTSKALALLARNATVDSDSAKQFLDMKLKFDKQREEKLGAYENLSSDEIIARFRCCVEQGNSLIEKITLEVAQQNEKLFANEIVRGAGPDSKDLGRTVFGIMAEARGKEVQVRPNIPSEPSTRIDRPEEESVGQDPLQDGGASTETSSRGQSIILNP